MERWDKARDFVGESHTCIPDEKGPLRLGLMQEPGLPASQAHLPPRGGPAPARMNWLNGVGVAEDEGRWISKSQQVTSKARIEIRDPFVAESTAAVYLTLLSGTCK